VPYSSFAGIGYHMDVAAGHSSAGRVSATHGAILGYRQAYEAQHATWQQRVDSLEDVVTRLRAVQPAKG
jgi:hypothetical protein